MNRHTVALSPLLLLLLTLATGHARADHGGHCNGNDHLGTDLAASDVVNGGPQTGTHDLSGNCMTAPQSAADTFITDSAAIASTTAVDYGLMTAHATVSSAAMPDYGLLAFYDSTLGEGYVGRTLDTITALTDTQLRLTTAFDFQGSFSGTVTSTSEAFGSIVVFGIAAGVSHTDSGGPGGTVHQVFSADFFLPAGSSAYLIASLGAHAEGSANGPGATGFATLDARYALGLQVLNAGGSVTALSGHDYLATAVPEPASWALLLGGVIALSARRRAPARSVVQRTEAAGPEGA
jgi:hypothetical protein